MTVNVRWALFCTVLALAAAWVLMDGRWALGAAPAADSKVVAARKKAMQSNGKLMKAIGDAIKAGEFPKVVLAASEVGENALDIQELFEKKDLSGKTTALAKLWDEKAKFDQIAGKLLNDSRAVVEAGRAKDKAKVEAAVKTMGSNCAACHKEFRQPPKK